jgi:hypothetical protein
MQRRTPLPGDYYVSYGGGRDSVSPRKEFEEGYSLTLMPALPDTVDT